MNPSLVEDWWDKLDGELLDCLTCGPMSASDLAARLGLSEASTVSLVGLLAGQGKVRIVGVERA